MRKLLLDKMVEQARKDGIITKDEMDIINKVSEEYGIYKNELESALSDHVITEKEFESLLKLRYKVYEKALVQALEDGTITEDEKDILNQMQKNLQLSDRDIEIIESKYQETFLTKMRKILGDKEELLSKYGDVEIIKQSTKEYPLYKMLMVELSPEEREIITKITNLFQSAVTFETRVSDPKKQEIILIEKIYDEVTKYSDDSSQIEKLALNVVYNITSIGVLAFPLKDDALEEIMVIGPNKPVYVFHRKHGLCETNLDLSNLNEINCVIERLASLTKRSVNYLNPGLEASLPEGPRVNVTIPPASLDGPTITIRKPHKDPLTIADLLNFKTITPELAAFLWMCVEGVDSPPNILIGGGTGSGKTVMLNVINGFIPSNERIVTLEETPELELPLPHVIRLQTQPPGAEGTGE
ncbi:MAG: ATPase, T2SS/T4P/T4SS family, partial [Candidatus Hydrothermarchaeales archaeon]